VEELQQLAQAMRITPTSGARTAPKPSNVALKRLKLLDIEHFTVHDMRRTVRTHLAGLGVNRFVAERSLNHKLGNVEGIYDRHDCFAERATALGAWAALLARVEKGEVAASPTKVPRIKARKAQCVSMANSG
jgi:integrase